MNERLRILILTANPVNTQELKLETEHRLLRNRMHENVEVGTCEILHQWAARQSDVQDAIKTYKPHIVHFAGHADAGGICLEDDEGECRPVSKSELSLLLNSSKDHLRLVTLNACSSAAQMEKLGQSVDYIVGTSSPVEDAAAVMFAAHFYAAVAVGSTVREAFHKAQGKLAACGAGTQADSYRLLIRPGADETEPLLPPFTDDSIAVDVAEEIDARDVTIANKILEGALSSHDEQQSNERNRVTLNARSVKAGKFRVANDFRSNSK